MRREDVDAVLIVRESFSWKTFCLLLFFLSGLHPLLGITATVLYSFFRPKLLQITTTNGHKYTFAVTGDETRFRNLSSQILNLTHSEHDKNNNYNTINQQLKVVLFPLNIPFGKTSMIIDRQTSQPEFQVHSESYLPFWFYSQFTTRREDINNITETQADYSLLMLILIMLCSLAVYGLLFRTFPSLLIPMFCGFWYILSCPFIVEIQTNGMQKHQILSNGDWSVPQKSRPSLVEHILTLTW
jgi:hypothetical protein